MKSKSDILERFKESGISDAWNIWVTTLLCNRTLGCWYHILHATLIELRSCFFYIYIYLFLSTHEIAKKKIACLYYITRFREKILIKNTCYLIVEMFAKNVFENFLNYTQYKHSEDNEHATSAMHIIWLIVKHSLIKRILTFCA